MSLSTAAIKPNHKAIQTYYQTLQSYADLHKTHETATRTAFLRLLEDTARLHGWNVITEDAIRLDNGRMIRPDATLYKNSMPRGYWEAKDTADDLDSEIRKKRERGYPLTNIIFEDTRQAVLFQNEQEIYRVDDLSDPAQLATLLNTYYAYTKPVFESYDRALDQFKANVPYLSGILIKTIETAHQTQKVFQDAFNSFFELCKTALNPNINRAAIDEMLVQHLLTERLIRKIFDNPEFTNRNVIAVEIEKVIRALVSPAFSRDEYLRDLEVYYQAIEQAAHGLTFAQKQKVLNEVYERFFQGYSTRIADTHGIVYTPQPIVDFMCASVVEVLQTEFGKSLGDKDVVILDPCTGTGNFIVNLLRRAASRRDLESLYRERLFANEIMLLPYYIAALNIEHAYYDLTGQYESFEGLCFVDTLDLKHGLQPELTGLSEENRKRIIRQSNAPITVIIGNPPYNVGQQNENDNNKNRVYRDKKNKLGVDDRIQATYAKDSKATLKTQLYDPYVKFFRWAVDRLQGRDGIVCYVSNNSFVDQIAFDGMRKHLLQDFTHVYHVDLHGNVRKNPKLSGTTHNVFGIQVGVGITIAIRSTQHSERRLFYHRVPESWRKEEKYNWLTHYEKVSSVDWQPLTPDNRFTWLVPENATEFSTFLPMGSKAGRSAKRLDAETIFKVYSSGTLSGRDSVVYNFNWDVLNRQVEVFCENYNSEVDRYRRKGGNQEIDGFVDYFKLKWSRNLKRFLASGKYADYDSKYIRNALYRPFTKNYVYFAEGVVDEQSQLPRMFPTLNTEQENRVIVTSDLAYRAKTPSTLITDCIPDLHLCASIDAHQCFPFYIYDEDGTNRRENITDWALAQFRTHYGDESISKWDIFYYVYGLLHHPSYRTTFADNLKRELPRIPFAPDFRAFVEAGRKLADLHLNYEAVEPYKLRWIEAKDMPLSYRVEKMRLNKDKTALAVNDSLTLADIPPEVYQYRLGNRSALEWVIDQYQVSTDKRSGITSDPNRADDPRYIVDLVERVVAVSVATVNIVAGLPEQYSDK